MNAALEPSSAGMSRFYEFEPGRLRLNRRTALAAGSLLALYVAAGYLIAHSYWQPQPVATTEEPHPVILDFFRPQPPPTPRPREQTPPPSAPPAPRPVASTVIVPEETLPIPVTVSHDPPSLPVDPVVTLPPEPTHIVTPPVRNPVISNPTWIKKPTADQVGLYYPRRALETGLAGRAVLQCEVQGSGSVANCEVTDETPPGHRFGEAALSMTRYFKLNPKTVDGISVAGSKVRIPIVFNPS